MAGIKDLTNIWNNLKELDLRPIAAAALAETRIALAGATNVGRHTLATQMRTDPEREGTRSHAAVSIAMPEEAENISADLYIVMVDARAGDPAAERALAKRWTSEHKPVIVFYNKLDLLPDANAFSPSADWGGAVLLFGNANDRSFLLAEFVPAVLTLLPDQLISLGRHLPLFRIAVAQTIINETTNANAMYSLSTGVAEIIPILDIPFNLADMVILTKAQALMVYKLGLVFGLSTNWQDHMSQFGSVIGGGFLWRQLARQLVGLVPVAGIVPKVAVAYAGTYVMGNAIVLWYQTGRNISRKQMRELYQQAFAKGKVAAANLLARAPRPALPSGKLALPRASKIALPLGRKTSVCPNCGKKNDAGAHFCQNCGAKLEPTD